MGDLLEQILLKDSEPRPIFIIGSYRSGTSVMTWALGQHPNIFPLEETYFLYKLSVDLDYLYEIGASRGARCFIGSAQLTPRYFRNYFGRACDILIKSSQERIIRHALLPKYRAEHTPNIQLRRSRKDPKNRWVDGTPENSYFVLPLLRMFPKAKFIHVLRNPKLVATSLMHFSTIGGTDYPEEDAYRIWMRMVRAAALAELAFGPERVLRVLYEDIVCDPETVIRRCLEFVGEDYHPACLLPFREKVNSSRYDDPGDCSLSTNLRSPKPWVREAFSLYEALLNGEVPGIRGRMSALRELYRSLREYENSLRPDTNERLSRDNVRLRTELERLSQELAEKERVVHDLSAQVAHQEQLIQHLQAQLAKQEQVVQQLQSEIIEKGNVFTQIQVQLQQEQERLTQQLAQREQAMQELQGQLTSLQQRLSWRRYRIADWLLASYWYVRHPKQVWQRARDAVGKK
jgi:hypothetical protein